MKLILTDYIASLKEEKELDSLIEQLLRECGFEIVFSPKKGERQYGVDIYAVGEDWEDGDKKLFLITVKQGNLDRKNWEGSIQAIQPSLQNIATVFVRNNIAPEHVGLPIKIIVAHNGTNDGAIQQNWKAFAEMFPAYQFVIWQLETIVTLVQQKLINENVFSDQAKRALRKIIIHLSDPDYDFNDYSFLLDEIFQQINLREKNKRHNLNNLRKINLLASIIISYCESENDLRLALKASEITILRLWECIGKNESELDPDYAGEIIRILMIRKDLHIRYLNKILPVCEIKDGLSIQCRDSVSYCFAVYEHLGFIALAGLEFLQLSYLFASHNEGTASRLKDYAFECAAGIIHLYNHNAIIFNPRADNQIIEISLAFLLLYKIDRSADIKAILMRYNEEMAYGKIFSNIAPHFHNNIEEIFELDINYKKRKDFDYQSSCLLSILIEWAVVLNNKEIYLASVELKEKLFDKIDLILWFPDGKTEELLYTQYAVRKSGYSLSGIVLTENFEEFKQITLAEYVSNCEEVNYSFFRDQYQLWIIGLIASRHYRTYIFPHYWRQFIENSSPFPSQSL
jgi:hypothetical protein